MDIFGIGAGVRGAINVYFRSGRASGRTTSLIESLKDGDRVVFTSMNHVRNFERLCKERDLKVDCIIVDPKEPGLLFEKGTSQGRTVFDHVWLEEFWGLRIDNMIEQIDDLQKETSGFGEPHYETRRQAKELSKWRL